MRGTDQAGDRFALWPQGRARLLLFALLLALIVAALTPLRAGEEERVGPQVTHAAAVRFDDLRLYDAVIERLRHGENYYDFIVQEHRRIGFPVRPGLAVRLPTLAYLDAWLGYTGQAIAAVLLLAAVMLAWWQRLGEEPGGAEHRAIAIALLAVGASLGLNRYFFVLHELWAGMLLALAFALHRPGRRWGAALAVAALALAIREHALPFVLLMAAMAAWRRDWKESAAWSLLAAAFVAALAVHLQLIAAQALPGDRLSASWITLRGLSGWLSAVALSSNLRLLPHVLAGPLIVLMVFGWAGWRSAAGSFATLLYLGYALFLMIAGRGENYYWGVMVAPAMFIGLAFVPMAAGSLWRAAFSNRERV